MTKEHINAQLTYAKIAYGLGNCDKALGHMQLAWDDLQTFSQQLAAARRSQSPAVKIQKQVAKLYATVRNRCHGDALISPTYRRGPDSGDLLTPTFAPQYAHPDLLAPSFSGAPLLTEGDAGRKPWLGLAAMVAVVAGGFWMASR